MKQKTIKGMTVEYGGNTIDGIITLYVDAYDKGEVSFAYLENESTTINVRCKLSEVKINTK